MDHRAFFDAIRKTVFKGRMSQPQVEGVNAILDSALRNNVTDPHHVADILANVRRETGGHMLPIKETVMPSHKDKNPSDATVIKRLDAAFKSGKLPWVRTPYWRDGAFGRGPIQITHWSNYEKMGKRLGIPLRQNPDLALDPDHGADIAVVGMSEGMFTGKKLSDYEFPSALDAKPANHPRRIVNGPDGSDAEIKRDHLAFHKALVDAGWSDAVGEDDQFGAHIYNGNKWPVIESVQEQLDKLGYPEVGAFDGRWGSKTRAAVLAFRADNGLPLTPTIDADLLAALLIAEPRPVASERKNATVADLRQEGAEDVKAADTQQIAGGVAAAGGAVVGVGKVLDQAEEYSGLLKRAADIIAPVQGFIQDNFWLLLIGVGAVVIWQSGVLKNIRLRKHQTGQDVSE